MDFHVKPKDKCPCGSGKEYRKCHSPSRNNTDSNYWRGPDYPQHVYIGHNKHFSGFQFEKSNKGEFILLIQDDRIPIGRFFCMDEVNLSCKAIIRSLSINLKDMELYYSGSIEIKGDIKDKVPILIGCINSDLVDEFSINSSNGAVSYKRGNWGIYIGEDDNPMTRIRKSPKWFRLLKVSGFLIEIPSSDEINFKLSIKARAFNIFTLALPFNNIEYVPPRISVQNSFLSCQLEVQNEDISWDLILCQELFNEQVREKKDSKILLGYVENNYIKFDNLDLNVRKYLSNPTKFRIGLSLPDKSLTIGEFTIILEDILKALAEDKKLVFNDAKDNILEERFRDYILILMKSRKYFAVAEPARKGGFVDILLKKEDSEAIIEFKVWGHRKYKEIIKQVLDYGTAWTTEYATVMINPNKELIVDKFIENATSSPGFQKVSYIDTKPVPLQKIVTYHYLKNWEKHIVIIHFIINLNMIYSNSN